MAVEITEIRSLVYLAWADDAAGAGFTTTFSASKTHMAILISPTIIATPVVGDFVGLWRDSEGPVGPAGPTGPTGPQGPDGSLLTAITTAMPQSMLFDTHAVYGPEIMAAPASLTLDVGIDSNFANGKEVWWLFNLNPGSTLTLAAEFFQDGGVAPGALANSTDYMMRMLFVKADPGGGGDKKVVFYTILAV